MDKDFFLAETDSGKGETRGSEENKALRDHIDEGGDSAGNGIGGVGFGAEASPEQKCTNRDEGVGNVLNNIVHEFEKFGIGGFDGVGGIFEFIDEIVHANVFDNSLGGARNYKTPRDEMIALVFGDIVLFAGDEGLIDLYGSLFNDAII